MTAATGALTKTTAGGCMAGSNSTGRIKLTKAFLSQISGTGKRTTYRDSTVPGLLLRVSPDGSSRVWYYDYYNQDGKRRAYRIGPLHRFELESAKREARKLAGIIAKGGDPAAEKTGKRRAATLSASRTVEAYLFGDYWNRHLQHKRSGLQIKARIASAWNPFLRVDMSKLIATKLQDHRSKRLIAGIKPTTLNRDRIALMALLNQAVEDGMLTVNPVAGFRRLLEEDDKRVRSLDPQERKRFMTALGNRPRYVQVMVELALLTGMRRGEILKLTWDNVDLRRKQITVRAATAKGAKTRIIPLPARAVEILRGWRSEQAVVDTGRHVFLNRRTGMPFTHIKKSWAALCKAAEVSNFRFHDCRHDYASRLVEAGVDLYRVKELLGHSSFELTQRYAHLSDQAKRDAVEVLG